MRDRRTKHAIGVHTIPRGCSFSKFDDRMNDPTRCYPLPTEREPFVLTHISIHTTFGAKCMQPSWDKIAGPPVPPLCTKHARC